MPMDDDAIDYDVEILPPDKPGGKRRLVWIERRASDPHRPKIILPPQPPIVDEPRACALCDEPNVYPWEHSTLCIHCKRVNIGHHANGPKNFNDRRDLAEAWIVLKHLEHEIARAAYRARAA